MNPVACCTFISMARMQVLVEVDLSANSAASSPIMGGIQMIGDIG